MKKYYYSVSEFANTFYSTEMNTAYDDTFTRDLFVRYLSHISNVYAYTPSIHNDYYDIMAHCKNSETNETYNIACELKYRDNYSESNANGQHVIDLNKYKSFESNREKGNINRGIIFTVYNDDVLYISDAFAENKTIQMKIANKTTRTGSYNDGQKQPKYLVFYPYLFKHYVYIFSKDGRNQWDILLFDNKQDIEYLNRQHNKIEYELF